MCVCVCFCAVENIDLHVQRVAEFLVFSCILAEYCSFRKNSAKPDISRKNVFSRIFLKIRLRGLSPYLSLTNDVTVIRACRFFGHVGF